MQDYWNLAGATRNRDLGSEPGLHVPASAPSSATTTGPRGWASTVLSYMPSREERHFPGHPVAGICENTHSSFPRGSEHRALPWSPSALAGGRHSSTPRWADGGAEFQESPSGQAPGLALPFSAQGAQRPNPPRPCAPGWRGLAVCLHSCAGASTLQSPGMALGPWKVRHVVTHTLCSWRVRTLPTREPPPRRRVCAAASSQQRWGRSTVLHPWQTTRWR